MATTFAADLQPLRLDPDLASLACDCENISLSPAPVPTFSGSAQVSGNGKLRHTLRRPAGGFLMAGMIR